MNAYDVAGEEPRAVDLLAHESYLRLTSETYLQYWRRLGWLVGTARHGSLNVWLSQSWVCMAVLRGRRIEIWSDIKSTPS